MGVAASFESHVIQIIHLSLKENARILMRVDIAGCPEYRIPWRGEGYPLPKVLSGHAAGVGVGCPAGGQSARIRDRQQERERSGVQMEDVLVGRPGCVGFTPKIVVEFRVQIGTILMSGGQRPCWSFGFGIALSVGAFGATVIVMDGRAALTLTMARRASDAV